MATRAKPKDEPETEVLSLRLDKRLLSALSRAAKKEDRTVSNLARIIIRDGVVNRGEAVE